MALLAERSTGWCLLSRDGYVILSRELRGHAKLAGQVDPVVRQLLQPLWESGLLLIDGTPHPDTRPERSTGPSSLLLKLTGACNFECTYCYDYHPQRFKARLTFERVEEALTALLSKQPRLGLVFHGGEPLLRFDLMKRIVARALELAGDRSRLSFSIQTNGSLFTPEVIEFLEQHDFSVGISLDGIDETSNGLRVNRKGRGTLEKVRSFLDRNAEFVRQRCGFLAVASRASAPGIPAFATWLQDQGINSLTVSFMDLTGRAGESAANEKLGPQEAVALYAELVGMVRKGTIRELALRNLISRIENLFTFQPRDFCHKGPCAAANDFLVLDAEGTFRSCDCVYDPFFFLGRDTWQAMEGPTHPARRAIEDRHDWLREQGADCSTCPLFGLCGGTCVAKAIVSRGTPLSIDPVECSIVRYLYPEILEEFDRSGEKPLLAYYHRHRLSHLPMLS